MTPSPDPRRPRPARRLVAGLAGAVQFLLVSARTFWWNSSRHSGVIGWATSAKSLARPRPLRAVRGKRARTAGIAVLGAQVVLGAQRWQQKVSLRLGMATNSRWVG